MGLNKFFAWLTGDAKPLEGANNASAGARDEIENQRQQYARDIATLGCVIKTPSFADYSGKNDDNSSS